MIFSKIIIERMFSYAGRQELNLGGATPGRNICLIVGRNGFGKTSLLNCMKLLFVGANDERVRTVGFPPRKLQQKQFVMGDSDRWSGLINRRARVTQPDCSVTAVWQERGLELAATRRWRITDGGRNWSESVEVREGGGELIVGEAAGERLSQLCPPEIVPFFFFDGEQIQELAESTDEKRAQEFDRLLGLRFIDKVLENMGKLRVDYERGGLPEEARSRLVEVDTNISRLDARLSVERRRCQELHREIEQLKERRQDLLDQRERLHVGRSQADKARLSAEIQELGSRVAETQRGLAEELPSWVPLLANPELVGRSLERLETVISHRLSSDVQLLETLKAQLPRALFETPPFPSPQISVQQKKFLIDRLLRQLDVFGPASCGDSDLTVSAAVAEKLRLALAGSRRDGPQQRRTIAGRLRALSRDKVKLKELRQEEISLTVESDEDNDRHQRLTREMDEISATLEAKNREVGKCEGQIERLDIDLRKEVGLRDEAQGALSKAEDADRHVGLVRNSAEVLKHLKEFIRRTRREEIELSSIPSFTFFPIKSMG